MTDFAEVTARLSTELGQAGAAVGTLGGATTGLAAEAGAAQAAVNGLTGGAAATTTAVEQLDAAQRQAGAAATALAGDATDLTQRVLTLEAANQGLAGELRDARAASNAMAGELRQSQEAVASLAGKLDVLETKLRGAGKAHGEAGVSAASQKFAMRDLGEQFSDLAVSVQGGIDPMRAFGQQGGQIAFALSGMQGKLGAIGDFLVGPYGAALILAISLGGEMVEKLLNEKDGADELAKTLAQAAQAADSYGTAQSLLGKVIDLTTGKLKTQNDVLVQTIRLQAQANIYAAQQKQREATETLRGSSKPSYLDYASGIAAGGIGIQGLAKQKAALAPFNDTLNQFANVVSNPNATTAQLDAALKTTIGNIDLLAKRSKTATADVITLKQAVLGAATTRNDQTANQQVIDAIDGKGIAGDLKPYARDKKPKAPKKPKSTEGLDRFGDGAATRIADIVGQYGTDPTSAALEKANKQVRALDDLIADLGRRKPPNFGELIASAEEAKVKVRDGIVAELANAFDKPKTLAEQAKAAFAQVAAIEADALSRRYPGFEDVVASAGKAKAAIREGLQRPFDDYVKAQRDSLAVLELERQGRTDQAEALREVIALERQMGPLTQAQKDAVLAVVEAQRAEQRQIDVNREHVQLYLDALGGIRTVVDDADQAFVHGDLGQLVQTPQKLLGIFQQLKGEDVMQSLFGDAFRDLADQAQGLSPIRQASEALAAELNALPPHVAAAGDALDTVAPPVNAATDALGGMTAQAKAAATALGVVARRTDVAAASAGAVRPGAGIAGAPGALTAQEPRDIVVTANLLPKLTRSPEALLAGSIGKLSETLLSKVGIGDDQAKRIGGIIGSKATDGLKGAATGAFVSGIANTFGVHLSSGGSQIGGALGSLSGIPGGSIIGSVLGGIVGNLFKKVPRGSAVVTSVDQAASLSGDREVTDKLSGDAKSIQSGIQKIADTLGAEVGAFNVSIGKGKTNYRVSSTGSNQVGAHNPNGSASLIYDGADEATAVGIAIQDAIRDGAVKGLSAAVQRALGSSSDIDKALGEALKVANLESMLGGVTGQINKLFKDADTQAAQRVGLAKKYGLDLLAVEKVNAEQRADLIASTLRSRIGSLQDLMTSLATGDLSEGSAVDKHGALLKQIASAQTDAEAGKNGAADNLAQLYSQLISSDRDTFGTGGPELAADRSAALAGVQRVIDIETARINTAAGQQQATTDAIKAGNALADENNDLLSGIKSGIDKLVSYAGPGSAGSALASPNYSLTARQALL